MGNMINHWIFGVPYFQRKYALGDLPHCHSWAELGNDWECLGYLLVLCLFYPSEEITVDISLGVNYQDPTALSWYTAWYTVWTCLNTLFQGNLEGAGVWNQPSHVMNATWSESRSLFRSHRQWGGFCRRYWMNLGSTKRLGWRALGNFNKDGGVVSQHVLTQHSFFELGRKGWMNSLFVRVLQYCIYWVERICHAGGMSCFASCSRNGLIPSLTCKPFSMWICSEKWAGPIIHIPE